MGTNYYAVKKASKLTNTPGDSLHIGKCSAGWTFGLHSIPEQGLNSLEDWVSFLEQNEDYGVIDENGTKHSIAALYITITQRYRMDPLEVSFDRACKLWPEFGYTNYQEYLDKNHAIEGPNNLLRRRIDGFCVSHGEGTWDCLVGEFS